MPDYLLTQVPQEWCQPLRPSPQPDVLGTLERAEAPGLNLRLATWTLALAPESAYRRHPSAQVLDASPLFRAFPGHSAAAAGLVHTQDGPVPFHAVFGSRELADPDPPPDDVFLLPVLPHDGRMMFLASKVWSLGDTQWRAVFSPGVSDRCEP